MISRYLQSVDERFASMALSPKERAAKLARLRKSRVISLLVVILLMLAGIVDFALRNDIPGVLLFALIVNFFIHEGIMTQIRILEILERMQGKPNSI